MWVCQVQILLKLNTYYLIYPFVFWIEIILVNANLHEHITEATVRFKGEELQKLDLFFLAIQIELYLAPSISKLLDLSNYSHMVL